MQFNTDYYQLLEIEKNATQDEIKKAYRKMALRYHPDLNSDLEAEEQFKNINHAYSVLADPAKRQYYDLYGTLFSAQDHPQTAEANRLFGRCMAKRRGMFRGCGQMKIWEEILRKR
jgi:DnaJ-class molecular chaperone